MTYETLQEITGYESGAVLYEDGKTIWIGNWSSINGIPREFALGAIGLGEPLTAKKCAVPQSVKQAMQEHEREQGTEISKSGFRAWRVNAVIVVIQTDWA